MTLHFENISETALWVAMHRAMETDRPDAHFKDPYARMLAGKRGEEILKKTRYAQSIAWSTIVRTCVIDEILMRLLKEHQIDTVVNLAAGLDARPYRMQLSPELNWIEADLPNILDFKEEALKDYKPVCRLERMRVDLSEDKARAEFLSAISRRSQKAIVITEGLLVYLTRDQVIALGKALAEHPCFRFWISDLASPVLLEFAKKQFSKNMEPGGFRMQFAPENGVDFFRPLGWTPMEFRRMMEESIRLNRKMPFFRIGQLMGLIFYSAKKREQFQNIGIVVLQR